MGARGPLPDPDRRRRNAPTIPTTDIPITGRTDPAPSVPSWVKLDKAGRAWWKWAWSTPQACAWGVGAGAEDVVARRASLEDDLAALHIVAGVDFDELGEDEAHGHLAAVVRRIAAMATGRLQLMREMRELDDRLGLTPKGMAALRWKVTGAAPAADGKPASAPAVANPYGHLRAVGKTS